MVRFDTEPLVSPLTPQETNALKLRRRRGDFGSPASPWVKVVGVIVFVLMFAATAPELWEALVNRDPHGNLMWFLLLLPILIILAVLLLGIRKYLRQRRSWLLLARFADTNGLQFGIRSAKPNYPGLLFNEGHSRASTLHLFSSAGVLADVGGYEYVTGNGKERSVHRWRFAAFRLPHPVPHLLLDAKANNMWKLTNLPKAFASSQRISLGEPFDSHYQLYAPESYGRDAFQLLPPNVMEALLNAPVVYDIEMVDDWLFCYTQSQQDLTHPDTWRLLETIANGVLGSLTPVVNRYSDPRALAGAAGNTSYGPGTPTPVAPLGRRLRSMTNPVLILLLIGFVGLIGFFLFYQMVYVFTR